MTKVKLGEVATYINGYAFKPQDWTTEGKEIIRIQNLTKSSKEVNYYAGDIDDKYLIEKGDILISWSGTLGLFEWMGNTAVLNQHIFKVVFDKLKIDKQYFKYVVEKGLQDAVKHSHGSTMKHLTKKNFDNILINYPSLEEQQIVSQKLGILDKIIQKRQIQLDRFNDLVKSRFHEMFGDLDSNTKGWKKEPLKKHADILVGYPFPSSGYSEKGIKIIGGYNLMQGYINWDDSKYWPTMENYEQYLLKDGDIVMAMDRPWTGDGFKMAFIDGTQLPALLIQRTACIRASDIENEFLYTLLNSQWFADHCNVKGSLVPHISNKDMISFMIYLPPNELQKEFVRLYQQSDKSQLAIKKSLEELETLKKSLMQAYFG